ncbi:MAG: virulence RhuM family protein [Candidatus Symbiothrix sp.]|jgi:hypothetical protein|nr:virulence RhuM family protein [Candidatus Symbiothrix sp.]
MNEQKNFLIYNAPNNDVRVDVYVQDETVWLTQKAMAQLFGIEISTTNYHLKEIYQSGELQADPTIRKIRIVQKEGNREVSREIDFYNLDAIISVGYRVNSVQATAFRIWATKTLKEYIVKGFVLDDNRLKQAQTAFGKDYFKELLQRIRSIRASERRIYQQITDIFAECSIDYHKDSPVTSNFYAMIQNKFHYAITGKTAAEIIYHEADRNKEHMGLTTWKNSPEGRILKSDVIIAKNYLQENEIRRLERTITGYFDYVEDLIENETTFTMADFAESVNAFLSFRKYKILDGKGKRSRLEADRKALTEYEVFNKTQKIVSDFDKMMKEIEHKQIL